MRKTLPFLAILLATASCGNPRESREASTDLKTYDVQEAPPSSEMAATDSAMRTAVPPAAPGIAVTAAPGVAFNYRYAFRLPGERISAVQEQHASACEKLGLDRCRITGMRYRLVNERDIEGMLAFKLDPAIARQFGKQAIDNVVQADGMLVDSEISGEDVGTQIDASVRTGSRLEEDLRRVEQQLARPGLRTVERAELQAQAQRLREAIRANNANREDKQESLAKTPMVFVYGSGDLVPGFDTHSPLRGAIEQAGDNLIGGLAVLLVLGVSILPWALLALLGWWAWRRLRRRPAAVETPTET
jgi:hypothetical protein